MMETLILRSDDMRRMFEIIGPEEVMRRVMTRLELGLAEMGRGDAANSPPRSGFSRVGGIPGVIENMPHYAHGDGVTVKIISYSPENRVRYNLPTVLGSVARIDEDNGLLVALSDAVLLTAVRTGAAAAIASKLLAHPDSATIGIIGAGAQSVTQLHALSVVFDISTVLVFDVNPANSLSLPRRTPFLKAECQIASVRDVLARADIICTATSVEIGAGPVLPDSDHKPHLHINSIGADEVGKTELPVELLRRAFVCVDHLEQARVEGESQQLHGDEIGPTLGYLCARPELARSHQGDLTVFDSTGFALEDHLALDVFLEMAHEVGLGEKVPIIHRPTDVYNPYSFD